MIIKLLKRTKTVAINHKVIGISDPLPADYITCWRLCFQETGKELKCWEIEAFGPPSPPEFFELDCDLNSENACKVTKCSYEYFHNRLEK
jgi:hypothetical protein